MVGVVLCVVFVVQLVVFAALASVTDASCPQVAPPSSASTGPAADLILASDDDHERAATSIGDAMAVGRLGLEEGIVRIEAAVTARYRSQLDALQGDLPAPRACVPERGPCLPR